MRKLKMAEQFGATDLIDATQGDPVAQVKDLLPGEPLMGVFPGGGVDSGRVRATLEPERLSGAYRAIGRLLCRSRRILLSGPKMDGRGCLSICFSNFHGPNAGPRR